MFQCFATSIKVIAKTKHNIFYHRFYVFVKEKTTLKLNFVTVGGWDRKVVHNV